MNEISYGDDEVSEQFIKMEQFKHIKHDWEICRTLLKYLS